MRTNYWVCNTCYVWLVGAYNSSVIHSMVIGFWHRMSTQNESIQQMLERERRNINSYSKFVKIPDGGYADLEFKLQEPDAIVTKERTFRGEVAEGSYSTTFKVVELDCDNTSVRTWEIGRTLALPILDMLEAGHNPLRIHRSGSGTATKYIPEVIE
jgi:hypothetical protein